MRRLKARALLSAMVLLAACVPGPAPQPGFRAAAAPITSLVFFDPARFSGDWAEVAAFRPEGAAPCGPAAWRFAPRPDGGLAVSATTCADPAQRRLTGTASLTGPGRLTLATPDRTEVWWMLWVDDGYRTAVVGLPSGRIGMILNRDTAIPPDRLQAARDILAWNGYDLRDLRPTRP